MHVLVGQKYIHTEPGSSLTVVVDALQLPSYTSSLSCLVSITLTEVVGCDDLFVGDYIDVPIEDFLREFTLVETSNHEPNQA